MTPPELPVYPSVTESESSEIFNDPETVQSNQTSIWPESPSPASNGVRRLTRQLRNVADRQRLSVADRIHDYGSTIRETASQWDREDANLAWVAHRVADRVDRAADYVRNRELEEIKQDAESFVRDHPLLVFGSLFVGGLVVANILKASGKSNSVNSDTIELRSRERLPLADQPEEDPWPSVAEDETQI